LMRKMRELIGTAVVFDPMFKVACTRLVQEQI
jgi:hypothetical protein